MGDQPFAWEVCARRDDGWARMFDYSLHSGSYGLTGTFSLTCDAPQAEEHFKCATGGFRDSTGSSNQSEGSIRSDVAWLGCPVLLRMHVQAAPRTVWVACVADLSAPTQMRTFYRGRPVCAARSVSATDDNGAWLTGPGGSGHDTR